MIDAGEEIAKIAIPAIKEIRLKRIESEKEVSLAAIDKKGSVATTFISAYENIRIKSIESNKDIELAKIEFEKNPNVITSQQHRGEDIANLFKKVIDNASFVLVALTPGGKILAGGGLLIKLFYENLTKFEGKKASIKDINAICNMQNNLREFEENYHYDMKHYIDILDKARISENLTIIKFSAGYVASAIDNMGLQLKEKKDQFTINI